MADVVPRRARVTRPIVVFSLLIPALGVAAWTKHVRDESQNSLNFVLNYSNPAGWKPAPHGPETLFRFIDPKTHLVLRGAVNQVISESNPTPELDTDGIAQYYVD